MLGRWLDPPDVRARKQLIRSGGLPRPAPVVQVVGVALPLGCLVPVAAAIAVLVSAGVLVGTRLGQSSTAAVADHVVVRVIDDAKGGPAVLSTQVIPLR